MSRLYTYVVRYDIGFAPNPYFGACTLATCKPGIRASASVGDVVVGLGSKQKGQHGGLVFGMRVDETLSFDEYWHDPRFARKKPHRVGSIKQRYGDNIYHRRNADIWAQEDGRHSQEDGTPNPDHVRRDTGSPRVLISRSFAYYGASAIPLPLRLREWDGFDLCSGLRNYRFNYPAGLDQALSAWLEPQLAIGVAGRPLDWDNLIRSSG